MRSLVCLLLLALLLSGQQPGAGGQSGDRCSIAGKVLNAANGEPVRNAKLKLSRIDHPTGGDDSSPIYTTLSDDQGRYAMKDIEPGRYDLSAERAGFGAGSYGARLSLDAGRRLSGIILRLTPHAVVTGHILDEDGEPLEHIRLSAVRSISRAGKREFWPTGRGAVTNDLGEYRLFDLAPGRYYLQALHWSGAFVSQPQGPSAGKAPAGVYVPTYYPGTTDIANAVSIELKAGDQMHGMDFTLFKQRSVRIAGHVTYPAQFGRQSVMLSLEPRGNVGLRWTLTQHAEIEDPNGAFELTNIVPGSYTLNAIALGKNDRISARRQIVVGSENVDSVVLALAEGATLPGRVIFEGPPPANLTQIEVDLRDLDRNQIRFGPNPCKVKPDGTFMLGNVGTDVYRAAVGGLPDGYYVKSVRIGDDEVKESGIDTTNGVSGPLFVTVSAKAGQIEGVVLNAKQQPTPGATVVLVPDPPLRDREEAHQDVTTDQYGRFLIRTIEPGEYKLFAWEVEPDDYLDPEFLKTIENLGYPIRIQEGSRESADLKLIPAKPPKVPK